MVLRYVYIHLRTCIHGIQYECYQLITTTMEKNYKCECGSENFYMTEDLNWKCWVDNDGELYCKTTDATREIACRHCHVEKNYEDFTGITFE